MASALQQLKVPPFPDHPQEGLEAVLDVKVSRDARAYGVEPYITFTHASPVRQFLQCEVEVVRRNLTLQSEEVEGLQEAECAASRRILQGSRVQLMSQELLDAGAGVI